jgi:hypothetical protein
MRLALLIVASLFTIGINSAAALPKKGLPTEATLEFTWSPDGSMTVVHTLNRQVSRADGCRVRLRAAIGGEAQRRRILTRSVLSKRVGSPFTSRILRVRAEGLPSVGRFTTGDAVLTIQAQTTCRRGRKIVSNAVARFVKCGSDAPRVSGATFLGILSRRARVI